MVSSFTVSLLEGEGEMGGSVVCLVSPEDEPGTPERKEPRGPGEYTYEMTCMRKLCFTAGLYSYTNSRQNQRICAHTTKSFMEVLTRFLGEGGRRRGVRYSRGHLACPAKEQKIVPKANQYTLSVNS